MPETPAGLNEEDLQKVKEYYKEKFSSGATSDFVPFTGFVKECQELNINTPPSREDYIAIYLQAHGHAREKIELKDVGNLSRVFDKLPTSFFFSDPEAAKTLITKLEAFLWAELLITKQLKPEVKKRLGEIREKLPESKAEAEELLTEVCTQCRERKITISSSAIERIALKKANFLIQIIFDNEGNIKERFNKILGKESVSEADIAHQIVAGAIEVLASALVDMKDKTKAELPVEVDSKILWGNFLMPMFNELGQRSDSYYRFTDEFPLRKILQEKLNLSEDEVDKLLDSGFFTPQELVTAVKTRVRGGAAVVPQESGNFWQRYFKPRTYSRIGEDSNNIRFLAGEPSLARLVNMLASAIKELRRTNGSENPLKIDFHILSVLDKEQDRQKIENVAKSIAFLRTAYRNDPRFQGVKLKIYHNVASMLDHQMREKDGSLLNFETMDSYLEAHHKESEQGAHSVSVIHCKAGQGRSATVMICEDIKYNGLLPAEASAAIKKSRPQARGIKEGKFRPDQNCFIYSYFFHLAKEALAAQPNTSSGEKLAEKLQHIEVADLITEVKYALSIDYTHRLADPACAKVADWKAKLYKAFAEFSEQFKDKRQVDLGDRLLLDYAENMGSYSYTQRENLTNCLTELGFPVLTELFSPGSCISTLANSTLCEETKKAIVLAVVKSVDQRSKWGYKIKKFLGLKPQEFALTKEQEESLSTSSYIAEINKKLHCSFPSHHSEIASTAEYAARAKQCVKFGQQTLPPKLDSTLEFSKTRKSEEAAQPPDQQQKNSKV